MIYPSYLFISLRYLQAAQKNSTIRTMMSICFFGIFIGTFSLALIVSIMKGFEKATYDKMQSIYPQIIIDADGQDIDYQKIATILDDPLYHIAHYAPEQHAQALCHSLENHTTPHVIMIKGIDINKEEYVTPIAKMIIPKDQTHRLADLLIDNQVIIGKQLAIELRVRTGSQITLMYTPEEDFSHTVDFLQKKLIVAGIFDTGIDEFDTNFIYCSSILFQELFENHGITQIYIQSNQTVDENILIKSLQQRLGLQVYSWKKLYRSLVAALELEKYGMFLILLLIILVASSNIISLLFMQITQKRKDIALLLTLGLCQKKVKHVFLTLSMTISILACCSGLIVAYLAGLFLQHFRWIKLPDNVYYTTHLPIIMDRHLFLYIFFVVLMMSFIASKIPLSSIKMKDIATILKNDI